MKKLKNQLTWSFSRNRLFIECRRAYYYHYYASWGGWDAGADEFHRKAYILKNIRTIDIWIGDIVHQVIKWILENMAGDPTTLFKNGRNVPYEEAVKTAKKLLIKTWEQSRSKQWKNNIKHNLNLFEHYYGYEPTREELRVKLEKVSVSIRNFYQFGLWEKFSKLPRENFLSIDKLDSFDFEGVRVFAIPDFALRNEQEYFLYDWKTGKQNEKDVWQLSCYQNYAIDKWRVSAEQIRIVPVYLTQTEAVPSAIKAIEPEKIKDYIRQSLKEIRSILVDSQENKADIKQCPKTDDTWRCKRCRFQEICT